MIVIEDTLVSDEILENNFVCDLNKCKGACCVEGDIGAPLADEEIELIEKNLEKIKPFMAPKGLEVLKNQGFFEIDGDEFVTTTHEGKDCVFSKYDENNILKCAIEEAHQANESDFLKPISCHLYPIRTIEKPDFEAINYDKWEICAPACDLGKALKVPVYKFLKTPLIRKYGADWFDQLEATADYIEKEKLKSSKKNATN